MKSHTRRVSKDQSERRKKIPPRKSISARSTRKMHLSPKC